MGRIGVVCGAVAAAAALTSASRGAGSASIAELPPLPGGASSIAFAIDDAGTAVGASDTAEGSYHAVLWKRDGGRFRARDLGTLPGGNESFARSVNGGRVVGESLTRLPSGQRYNHAFLWERGEMKDLGVLPGASATVARAITPRGKIVGTSDTPQGLMSGVQWKHGQLHRLGEGSAPYSFGYGGNDRGAAVGRYSVGTSRAGTVTYAPYLLRSGNLRRLRAFPGSQFACAYAINGRGQVVGESETGLVDAFGFRVRHAVRWEGDRAIDLGTLFGGAVSCAYAISRDGRDAVGYSENRDGAPKATLWRGGRCRDLNRMLPPESGWELHIARGVNRQRVVVGEGAHRGRTRAFRLQLP
jgi:probable HAF family extracellular repeat protein